MIDIVQGMKLVYTGGHYGGLDSGMEHRNDKGYFVVDDVYETYFYVEEWIGIAFKKPSNTISSEFAFDKCFKVYDESPCLGGE